MFNPITASDEIVKSYVRYLSTLNEMADTDYQNKFVKLLKERGNVAKGPYLDVTQSFEKGNSISELVYEDILEKEFFKLEENKQEKDKKLPLLRPLYKHQEEAIRNCVKNENTIVSTGTGSGKTESFLIPILNELMKQKRLHKLDHGVRALIVYPMNALANDQMKRLRAILDTYESITFGCYTGETENKQSKALDKYWNMNKIDPKNNELISREQMRKTPPHILITNYAMLEYLMLRPDDDAFFNGNCSNEWKYIVLDEAHTYKGASGIEVSMLLRRLKASIKSDELQYILTSATLGNGEKDNVKIIEFASQLCDAKFSSDAIIRSKRINIKANGNLKDYDIALYRELSDINLNNKNEVIDVLNKYDIFIRDIDNKNVKELIYELILNDRKYYEIKNILNKPKSIVDISKYVGVDREDIVSFVNIASRAEKNGERPFEARYHMFIRALEGVYITLPPHKKLYITRHDKVIQGNEEYKVFEIVTCKYCNEIYLVGKIRDNKLEQANYNHEDSDNNEISYFLINNENILSELDETEVMPDEHIDYENQYYICSKCGHVSLTTGDMETCGCGKQFYNQVTRVKPKGDILHTCIKCSKTNSRGSVLNHFYAGQEAATSVLGTSLYEQLPGYELSNIDNTISVEEFDEFDEFGIPISNKSFRENKKEKQYLVFSDSRQSAAYYSGYFDNTYKNIIRKRLITKVVEENKNSMTISAFVDRLIERIEKLELFKSVYGRCDSEKEGWISIITELMNISGRYSLEGLGLIFFKFKEYNTNGIAGLTKKEFNDFLSVIVNKMRYNFAICNSFNLKKADLEMVSYNEYDVYYSLADNKNYKKTFIPKKNNYILDYTMKVTGLEKQKAKVLLESIWKNILIKCEYLKYHGPDKYQVNSEAYNIISGQDKSVKWYICNKCKTITPYNVKNKCPKYKCDGELLVCNPNEYLKNNHYRYIYKNMELNNAIIKEHTAQLSRKKAYEYQEFFINKNINILSCSTTFEMGVDVGDLETVFMRNVPPSPANYAQRAGRAGRRSDSAAYALTYCKLSSHDFTYFNEPTDMIAGKVLPPKFEVENSKIILRHVYAAAFSAFWKKYNSYWKQVKDLFFGEGLERFKSYLTSKPKSLQRYLEKFVPNNLLNELGIKDYSWVNKLLNKNRGNEGLFTTVCNALISDYELLKNSRKNLVQQQAQGATGISKNIISLEKLIKNIENEQLIGFLSKKNLLPKYGFPVDSVELTLDTDNRINQLYNKNSNINLSRDLMMAISEYAPDSEIIVDGVLLRSKYIKKIQGKNATEWKRYDYCKCPEENCNYININLHVYNEKMQPKKCEMCGADLVDFKQFIILVMLIKKLKPKVCIVLTDLKLLLSQRLMTAC